MLAIEMLSSLNPFQKVLQSFHLDDEAQNSLYSPTITKDSHRPRLCYDYVGFTSYLRFSLSFSIKSDIGKIYTDLLGLISPMIHT